LITSITINFAIHGHGNALLDQRSHRWVSLLKTRQQLANGGARQFNRRNPTCGAT
jgi:hypothetical protein